VTVNTHFFLALVYITGFFGLDLDEDHAEKTQRWTNRRMRLYKGKVKDEHLLPADSDDFLSSSQYTQQIKYIHDPYRKAGRHSEISSRRTTPLRSPFQVICSTESLRKRLTPGLLLA
jgi:uncharacterized metal-binding protein